MPVKKILFLIVSVVLFFGCNNNDEEQNKKNDKSDKTDSASIEDLSSEIRNNPRNSELFNKRAEIYADKGKYKKAINDLEVAIKIDSLNKDLYHSLIDYHMKIGQSGKAKNVALKCLKVDSEDKRSLFKLAQIYFYVKDYKESISYIKKIKDFNLEDADTYFLQGLVYKENNKTDLAIKAFQKAIEYDKEKITAYLMLGKMLSESNDPLAIEYFNAGLRKDPDNSELHYNLGFHFQQNDMLDSAVYHYNYIIENLDKENYQAYYNKGFINLVYRRNYHKAIKNFTHAIKIDSAAHKAFYNRGYAYELLGDKTSARADYNKALDIKENYKLAIEGLNSIDNK